MLLFLMTAASALALQSCPAFGARDLYGNDLMEKARDAVAEVINSIGRPAKRQEPETGDAEDVLDLLLRPNERLEKDLREMRFLLELANSHVAPEPSQHGRQPARSKLMEVIADQAVDRKRSLVTLWRRTCRVRLGGHCKTEELDRRMKAHEYLSSPDSPGRRRRRSLRSILTSQGQRQV